MPKWHVLMRCVQIVSIPFPACVSAGLLRILSFFHDFLPAPPCFEGQSGLVGIALGFASKILQGEVMKSIVFLFLVSLCASNAFASEGYEMCKEAHVAN